MIQLLIIKNNLLEVVISITITITIIITTTIIIITTGLKIIIAFFTSRSRRRN
jgi:hypothetical protein